jgi:hypothetical protein
VGLAAFMRPHSGPPPSAGGVRAGGAGPGHPAATGDVLVVVAAPDQNGNG